MSIIGTYSVSGYEATTHTNEYSTINELLLQIQDNNTNEINAENIRNSVYTVWNKYIRGTNYIVAKANGTFIENAAELITLYNEAKTMTPGGSALSNTNRYTIYLPAGRYDFQSDELTLDASYIDFISLSGKADVYIITTNTIAALSIRANDIYVKGINVGDRRILLGGDYPLVVCENCEGGNDSFNSSVKLSSTFINCIGGEKSFGYDCSITGVFKNCVASNNSFGYLNKGSAYMQYAVFDKCVAGNYSFGYGHGRNYEEIRLCTFTDCVAGDYSFAINYKSLNSTITCRNCIGGDYCFGSNTTPSRGTYENCVAGICSFGESAEGTYRNCKAGEGSFGTGIYGIKGKLYFCIMNGSDYDFSGGGSAYGSVDANRFYGFNTDLEGYFLTTVTDDFALAGGTYSFVNGLLVTFTPNT